MAAMSSALTRPSFFEAVEKWADLDFGADLKAFLNDIAYTDLSSYAQLLYFKDKLLDAVVHSLCREEENVSLPALFEFSEALARDLRDHFRSHFWALFDAICDVLAPTQRKKNRSEQTVLEVGFRSLANIAQMHFDFISNTNFKPFLSRLSRLLGSNEERVRESAAKAFAFVFWRLTSRRKFCKYLFAKSADGGHLRDGIVRYLFALLTNGGREAKQFDEKAGERLGEMVQCTFEMEDGSALRQSAVNVLDDVFRKCIFHTNSVHSRRITQKLLDLLECVESASECGTIVEWILLWLSERKGVAFGETDRLVELAQQVLPLEHRLRLLSALAHAPNTSPALHTIRTAANSAISALIEPAQNEQLRDQLPLILEFFGRLCSRPGNLVWCMELVGALAAALLPAVPAAPSTDADTELQRKLLAFYGHTLSRAGEEQCPDTRRVPPFDIRAHLSLRKLVVLVLHSPGHFPEDFLDAALAVWPWLWRRDECPQGLEAVRRVVVDGVKRREQLPPAELNRIWLATAAALPFERAS